MRPVLPIRSRVALWLAAPAIAFVVFYTSLYIDPASVRGYWEAAAGSSAIFLLFTCSMAATAAAVEGSRERRGGLERMPVVRSSWQLVAVRIGPVLVVAWAVQLIAFVMLSRWSWGAPGMPPLILGPTLAAIIFFHAALGYLLGRHLPMVASVPVALVLSYGWLGFTWSVNYFPIRYLSGLVIANCCSVETQLDLRSAVVALVFNLLVGTLLLVASQVRPRSFGGRGTRLYVTLGAAIAVVTIASLTLAGGLGSTPVRERPAAQARCVGTGPSVCLFPEQREPSDPTATIQRIAANLEAVGISVPKEVRTSNRESTMTTLNVVVNVGMSNADLVHSYTTSLLPPTIVAYCGSESDYNARTRTAAVVDAWLIQHASAGVTNPQDVTPAVPDGAAGLAALQRLDAAQQSAWIRRARHSLADCSTEPVQVTE